MELRELKTKLDLMIKDGRPSAAAVQLLELSKSTIPRELLADFATLSRRAHLTDLSLKMLYPIIHSEHESVLPATDAEKASYAISLGSIGCLNEAVELLNPLKDSAEPSVLLAAGFLFVRTWDYSQAISVFTRYLEIPALSTYQSSVAKLNLAAAYNFLDEPDTAVRLLEEVLEASHENGWTLLKRDALLLRGQSHFASRTWDFARRDFLEAERISRSNGLDSLLIEKWFLLLDIQQNGLTSVSLDDLRAMKEKALSAKRWEVSRDLDYYNALNTDDRSLLTQVYFGTPIQPFRERLLKESGLEKMPSKFLRTLGSGSAKGNIDLSTGDDSSGATLQGKDLLLRTLRALAADFYKPLPLGSLFSVLYSGEHYNPLSSPKRVAAAVGRLNFWLQESEIPLSIHSNRSQFSIVNSKPYGLLIRLKYADVVTAPPPDYIENMKSLKNQWPYKSFSSRQAAEHLGQDIRIIKVLLGEAENLGRIFRSGTGRSTLFRFRK